MKTYTVTKTIRADPARIWALLVDAARYPEWNPSVIGIEGSITEGGMIKVFAAISPDRAFPVRVEQLLPEQKMVWRGGMPLGLFKGIRQFILTPEAAGTVRFEMSETFSGLMAPLITRMMPDLTESFEQFASGLKGAAEAS